MLSTLRRNRYCAFRELYVQLGEVSLGETAPVLEGVGSTIGDSPGKEDEKAVKTQKSLLEEVGDLESMKRRSSDSERRRSTMSSVGEEEKPYEYDEDYLISVDSDLDQVICANLQKKCLGGRKIKRVVKKKGITNQWEEYDIETAGFRKTEKVQKYICKKLPNLRIDTPAPQIPHIDPVFKTYGISAKLPASPFLVPNEELVRAVDTIVRRNSGLCGSNMNYPVKDKEKDFLNTNSSHRPSFTTMDTSNDGETICNSAMEEQFYPHL